VVVALRAQAVGQGERPLEPAHVERARQRRELVDDHDGLGLRHRPRDRLGLERVGDGRPRTQAADHVLLGRRARHADDLVAVRDEQGNELLAERPGGAGYEDLHAISFRLIRLLRRDGAGACDSGR
jgi:hypothetical protein